jgi:6-phosphogluconate dehydrogenase (decarboxylating)
MSKISKTAKASMKGPAVAKKERTDEELIKELRNDRASHIWPSVPAIDALLRAYDTLLAEADKMDQSIHGGDPLRDPMTWRKAHSYKVGDVIQNVGTVTEKS